VKLMRRAWLGPLALSLALSACDADALLPGSKGCTEIGCVDSLSVTVRPQEGSFPAGQHELFVATAEGGPARHCTIALPGTGSNGFATGTCVGGVSLSVSPQVTCTTSSSGNAVSQSCLPIPGKFEEQIGITGTPARVRIIQRTSTGTFIDRELAVTYKDTRPNGAGCPPLCRQASEQWTFAAGDTPGPGVSCAPSACRSDDDCATGTRCMQRPLSGPCVQYVCE
jgi:hypothetical protein